MRRALATMIMVALFALPAMANDGGWVNCFSVQLTWADGTPSVAGTNGDTLADGSTFEMAYSLDGSAIMFEFGGGAAQAHLLDPGTIDATACEDGSVFLNSPIEGQEPSWDVGDAEDVAEAAPVVEPTTTVEQDYTQVEAWMESLRQVLRTVILSSRLFY